MVHLRCGNIKGSLYTCSRIEVSRALGSDWFPILTVKLEWPEELSWIKLEKKGINPVPPIIQWATWLYFKIVLISNDLMKVSGNSMIGVVYRMYSAIQICLIPNKYGATELSEFRV